MNTHDIPLHSDTTTTPESPDLFQLSATWQPFDDPDFVGLIVHDAPDCRSQARLCFVQKRSLAAYIRQVVWEDFHRAIDLVITAPQMAETPSG